MTIVLFLLPFVLLGIAVIFVAFSGGPGRAREAYLTGGDRGFRLLMPLLYVALGIAVPLVIILAREDGVGAGRLASEHPGAQLERGKQLFGQTCASCHSLDAVNARGVTGPDLDDLGEVTPERVMSAIEVGGTGQDRMPAGLLRGDDAEAVAAYVSAVAGKSR